MTTTSQHDRHTHLRRSLRTTAEQILVDARALDNPHRRSRVVDRSAADQGGAHDRPAAGGVDGVGVTLVVDGESVFVGANPFTDAVDKVQYHLDEGPCLSAVASGRMVTSTRIATTERRWHRFTPEAAALDLRSVRSAPITSGGRVVGSINMYSRTPHGLTTISPTVLRRLADAAEVALSSARLLALAESGGRHLAHALDARAVIEHAVGLLMDRYLMNATQARTLLAQLARHEDTTVAAAARALTDPVAVRDPDPDSPEAERPDAAAGRP